MREKLARFLTLTGVQSINSTIVSLFQKCSRQCHLSIKQKVATITSVDVAVGTEQSFFVKNHAYNTLEHTIRNLSVSLL